MSLDAEMSDSESNSSIHIDKLDNGVGADYGKLAGALDTSGIKAAIDASGLADSIASKGLKATIDSGALEKVANISGIAKSIDTGALKAASEALGGLIAISESVSLRLSTTPLSKGLTLVH